MRILPPPGYLQHGGSREPQLGIEEGGIHTVEALALARYFMFTQVYFHPVRRIYDIHLKDFLKDYLPSGTFSIDPVVYLDLTDEEVYAALRKASRLGNEPGHKHALRIINRDHFRKVYSINPDDNKNNPLAIDALHDALCREFGKDNIRMDKYRKGSQKQDCPVLSDDGRIMSSLSCSKTLSQLPETSVGYIFADPGIREKAEQWIDKNREVMVKFKAEE